MTDTQDLQKQLDTVIVERDNARTEVFRLAEQHRQDELYYTNRVDKLDAVRVAMAKRINSLRAIAAIFICYIIGYTVSLIIQEHAYIYCLYGVGVTLAVLSVSSLIMDKSYDE